jgi:gliding motility-associated-like protein
VLGTQQTINFAPPPASGTTIAVALTPYDGYGCPDTLFAKLIDTLSLKAKAGADQISCNKDPVFIGDVPQPGINYSWDPPTGLSNSYVANPRAGPDITTQYILTIRSNGGGCVNTDTVIVIASFIDTTLQLEGKREFCINTGDSAVLVVQPASIIQWSLNGNNISGATQPRYQVNQSGNYFASMMNSDGCIARTRTETIRIETPRPGITYPLQYAIINIPVQLQARTFGSSVQWRPSSYLDNPTLVTPQFTAASELEQQYIIDIITAAGCLTVDTQQVIVIKEVKVYVPTAFSPNNDGLNDFLKPIMMGIKELQYFKIFHRGGQLVYDYNNANPRGWDGKIGGILQTTGVYVWVFSGIGWDKQVHFQKGTLTLIR